jgi:regulator of cell morphogenesis and NO signaling
MQIHEDTLLREIANTGQAARRLLERSGLDFCCHGDRTLGDACKQAGVDRTAVEDALRTLPPPAGDDWAHTEVAALVDHVLGDCHPETERRLAALEALANGLTPEGASELRQAVVELASATRAQMREEEERYFVRVRALADARKGRGPFPSPPFRTIHEHEKDLRARHADIYERFRRARALSAALRGPGAALVRNAVGALGVALLEQLHLENNLLLPLARDLEPNGHARA